MYNIPKIDLHLHLDGSLNMDLAYKKAVEKQLVSENISFSDFKKLMEVHNANNLSEYLAKFDLAITLLQTENDLFDFTYQLIVDLEKKGIIYAEIRFAPQFLVNNNQELAVKTVLRAKEIAKQNGLKIEVNFILCMMVLGPLEKTLNNNIKTIHLVNKYLNKGVCAIDLAGAEGLIPMSEFKSLFDLINDLDLPMTIHAGEQAGPESVKTAISFNTKRIGHGIKAIEDLDVIKSLIENSITLEVCPTSNINTKNQQSYQTHVIKDLLDLGVKVCVNTDNMTVSNTDLDQEYLHLIQDRKLTKKQILLTIRYAIEASFASENLKNNLLLTLSKADI